VRNQRRVVCHRRAGDAGRARVNKSGLHHCKSDLILGPCGLQSRGPWPTDAAPGPYRGPPRRRFSISGPQCCVAVRSAISAALRAARRSIRSTAVYCGELYYVVESRNGVNRTLSLRAFRFNKARFFAKKKNHTIFQKETLSNSNIC